MTEMAAAILYGREDVRVESVPIPPVGLGEIRVRIHAALTCGTDVKVYRRGYHARMLTPPCRFGHEWAGEIDAIGEGVDGWKTGDRVVAANSAPCGVCFYCGRGQTGLCEDLLFLNGAFAQYIVVPERIVRTNLLGIPDSLSYEAAALVEPLACAAHGVAESDVRRGDSVIVLGGGPIGLMFVSICARVGAAVTCIARSARGREAAIRMGAERAVSMSSQEIESLAIHSGRGADRVIECVGVPETWEMAIGLARKGGLVNLFGGCAAGTSIRLDTERMHYDALKLVSPFHHTPESVRRAHELLAEGAIPTEPLITDSAPLSKLPEVMDHLAKRGGGPKTAVHP